MSLDNIKVRKTYLSISHGKVVLSKGGEKEYYTSVSGTIRDIYTKISYFGKEEVKRWFIDMKDGEELYSLCLPYKSGVFKSIILSLASEEHLSSSTSIRIMPYEAQNGYTRVSVYADGEKLDWVTNEIPPQELITIGGRRLKDDTKQMNFITSLSDEVRKKVYKN